MQQSEAYEFECIGGIHNTYLFSTVNGVSYHVKFKPSGYIFAGSPPFADYVFEFVIELVYGNLSPNDPKIPATVSAILYDFFESNETVIVYLCDDSDGRASARNRKFSQWFQWYDRSGFSKTDFMFGSQQEPYYATVIIGFKNPYLRDILELFTKLLGSHQKP